MLAITTIILGKLENKQKKKKVGFALQMTRCQLQALVQSQRVRAALKSAQGSTCRETMATGRSQPLDHCW